MPQSWGRIIDHAESIDGGLTTVGIAELPRGPVRTLLTNGKFQGNDASGGEMQAQVGIALAPLLHQERRGAALVIGYGTGVTTRVFHEAGFRRIDVAELSPDIVRLADTHFARVNLRTSSAPGVRMNLTDGRNLLLLSPDRYDVISIEITSIWFAGAGALYNQEFYRLARAHMAPDGVLQQWVQLHRLSPLDLMRVMATLRSEFSLVSLYVIGGQGILVATNAAERADPLPAAMAALQTEPRLAAIRRIAGDDLAHLPDKRLMTPPGIDTFIRQLGTDGALWLSTDDNMRLEYDTPRANVNDPETSYKANLALLSGYR